MALPRGLRNNNPGNIEFGDFARRHGAIGSDGRFAIFPDMASGVGAMRSLLGSYQNRGLTTVAGMINRWAPPSDNNPTSDYARTVAARMGVGVNDPIQPNDNMIAAMISVENGIPFQEAAGIVGGAGIGSTAQTPSYGSGASQMAQTAKPPLVKQDFNQRAQEALQAAQDYLNFDPAQNGPQNAAPPLVQPQFTPVPTGDPRSALARVARDRRAGPRGQDPRQRAGWRWAEQMMPQLRAMLPETPPPPPQAAPPPLMNGSALPAGYQSLPAQMPLYPASPPWLRAPNYQVNPSTLPPPVIR